LRQTPNPRSAKLRRAVICAAIGGVGGLTYLFAFPGGAISTLMHDVLHLPGPGAGIAVVLGPCLIVLTVPMAMRAGGRGSALIGALGFAAAVTVAVHLFDMPVRSAGAFGSAWFGLSMAVFGGAMEIAWGLAAKRGGWRAPLAGIAANVALLVFDWVVIFPRTARWVEWRDVPTLAGLAVVAGALSAYIAAALSRSLFGATDAGAKE
jgi:hypothetical protein